MSWFRDKSCEMAKCHIHMPTAADATSGTWLRNLAAQGPLRSVSAESAALRVALGAKLPTSAPQKQGAGASFGATMAYRFGGSKSEDSASMLMWDM